MRRKKTQSITTVQERNNKLHRITQIKNKLAKHTELEVVSEKKI